MKNRIVCKGLALLLVGLSFAAFAEARVSRGGDVDMRAVRMANNDGVMNVSMGLDLIGLELKGNQAVVLTPVIVNGENSLELPAVSVYGRTRWYQHVRSGRRPLGGEDALVVSYSKRPHLLEYSQDVPYQEWMDGARVELRRADYGCCGKAVAESTTANNPAGSNAKVTEKSYQPVFHYVKPAVEQSKVREASATAYVVYQSGRTDIQYALSSNRAELAKITSLIDSVRNDADITVSQITFKGYASPEGAYRSNEQLAKGRVEALRNYIRGLYNFSSDLVSVSYEPEDWAGLREQIVGSSLTYKAELLYIIDDPTLSPDAKELRIRERYPDDYRYIFANFYPSLRRSDCRIVYTVRSYDDVETIRVVMDTAPQKLSLNEMYMLAETYERGSEAYGEVFETAARLYPGDETANLNAANVAMSRGDLRLAERYLSKAGNGGEAVYARALLAGLNGDVDGAESLLRQASAMGVSGVNAAIQLLQSSFK